MTIKYFLSVKFMVIRIFGDAEDEEWLVDDILAHRWEGNKVSFLVQWNLGDTTWKPYNNAMNSLHSIDT